MLEGSPAPKPFTATEAREMVKASERHHLAKSIVRAATDQIRIAAMKGRCSVRHSLLSYADLDESDAIWLERELYRQLQSLGYQVCWEATLRDVTIRW